MLLVYGNMVELFQVCNRLPVSQHFDLDLTRRKPGGTTRRIGRTDDNGVGARGSLIGVSAASHGKVDAVLDDELQCCGNVLLISSKYDDLLREEVSIVWETPSIPSNVSWGMYRSLDEDRVVSLDGSSILWQWTLALNADLAFEQRFELFQLRGGHKLGHADDNMARRTRMRIRVPLAMMAMSSFAYMYALESYCVLCRRLTMRLVCRSMVETMFHGKHMDDSVGQFPKRTSSKRLFPIRTSRHVMSETRVR